LTFTIFFVLLRSNKARGFRNLVSFVKVITIIKIYVDISEN